MSIAYFDEDGICTSVVEGIEDPSGHEVPEGTRPRDVWWDGEAVQPSKDFDQHIPDTLEVGLGSWTCSLPDNTVATVNGERQRRRLLIPVDAPDQFHVEISGAYKASQLVSVLSYADSRKKAYPAIGEQLDVIWKALGRMEPEDFPELQDMLSSIRAVKEAYPKPKVP